MCIIMPSTAKVKSFLASAGCGILDLSTMALTSESPRTVAESPYQSKQSDVHSSHSLILRLAGQGSGRRLLDVGAAHGYLAAALQAQGFQVTGIEAIPVLAEEAAKHCDEFFLMDLDGPPRAFAKPFDLIVFGDVLEHLKDPLRVLRDFAGSLKDDGKIIISLPNVANFYVRLNLLLGRFDYQDRGIMDRTHLHFYTRKTFRAFLHEAGLEIDTLTATPVPLPLVVPEHFQGALFRAVHGFNARLARTWQTMFGYQFVAVARKQP